MQIYHPRSLVVLFLLQATNPAGISSYSNYETIKSFTKYRYCFLCSGILNFNFLLA